MSRCDNSRCYGLVNDLSCPIDYLAGSVESRAHDARCLIIERAVAWLQEWQDRSHKYPVT
jgi:hypothetical protein